MRLYRFDQTAVETTPYDREAIRPEETLESWLHANPDIILDEPLLIIGQQVRLETGVADLIACDQFGNIVICEVKIGRSGSGSASEETILSQPQNYAQSISTYGYDALNDIYQEYLSTQDIAKQGGDEAIGGTLQSAYEARFGESLDDDEFNTYQRIVVVAEDITRRTEQNARYLLQEGLNFQCVEIQWLVSPEVVATDASQSVLASAVVVDYDLNRVRPKQRESPTYPDLVSEIVEYCFPSIQGIVHAEVPMDVFPDGFDVRGAALRSRHPDHPDGVEYGLAVKPDHGEVLLTIDNLEEDPDALDQIQSDRAVFMDARFTVKDNIQYRLVEEQIPVESVGDVQDRFTEIGERFEMLVRLGHEVLAETTDEKA